MCLFVCLFVIFVIGSLEILMTHYLLSRVWDLCDPPFVAFVIFVISAKKKSVKKSLSNVRVQHVLAHPGSVSQPS